MASAGPVIGTLVTSVTINDQYTNESWQYIVTVHSSQLCDLSLLAASHLDATLTS